MVVAVAGGGVDCAAGVLVTLGAVVRTTARDLVAAVGNTADASDCAKAEISATTAAGDGKLGVTASADATPRVTDFGGELADTFESVVAVIDWALDGLACAIRLCPFALPEEDDDCPLAPVLSAWAIPDPLASAAPTPKVTAPAPSQA